MIAFFRKIRQKLLLEGHSVKYLKYAFGEIVLVVIGILIALQINNWNEWKKERRKEEKILLQVKNNIAESIQLWETVLTVSDNLQRNYEVVITAKEQNLPYHDSLQSHFKRATWIAYNWTTSHSTSSFEALKSIGFDIIQNDSLSALIIEVFDKHITRVQRQYQEEQSIDAFRDYEVSRVNPLTNNFDSSAYKALLEDNYYYAIIQSKRDFRELITDFLRKYHLPAMKRTVKLIDEELTKLR